MVAKDGTIAANRGVPANGKATVKSAGGDQEFIVPFASDLSTCAYTATPMDVDAPAIAVSTGTDKNTVVVTEKGATPFGFHLQVSC